MSGSSNHSASVSASGLSFGSSMPTLTAPSTPVFGNSSPFFGAITPTFPASTPTFGSPMPTFGASSTPFGNSSSSFGATPPTFTASTPTFESPMPTFGASSTPSFGNSSSSFSGSSIFQQRPALGSSFPFGSSILEQRSAQGPSSPFGSSIFEQRPALGSSSPFGSSIFEQRPALESSSPFGSSIFERRPALGSSSLFDMSFQSGYGANIPIAGTTNTPASGSTTTSLFGSTPTPTFGSTGTGFAMSAAPAFGSGGTFSASSVAGFGISGIPAISSSSCPAFFASSISFGGQHGGSRVTAYSATTAEGKVTGNLESISAMPAYNDRSPEELRWEDYRLGDRGGPNHAGQSAGGIYFGASTSSPFNASSSKNHFMETSSTTPGKFGAVPSPAFGASSSPFLNVAWNLPGSVSLPSIFVYPLALGAALALGFGLNFVNTPFLSSMAPLHGQTNAAIAQNTTPGQNITHPFGQSNGFIIPRPLDGFGQNVSSSSQSLFSQSNPVFGQTIPPGPFSTNNDAHTVAGSSVSAQDTYTIS